MRIRPVRKDDRPRLSRLLETIENFTPDEVACALELVDAACGAAPAEHPDYRMLVADPGGEELAGYVCYGPTPMTAGTWDLYWIASSPAFRGKGAGHLLLLAMEEAVRARGGENVRIETSSQGEYAATRSFYERHRYPEASRLRDFYRPGDDLVTLYRRLG